MKPIFYYMLFLMVLPVACSAPKSTVKPSVINLSKMYNPTNTKLHPAYTLYHSSPSTSLLFIKIFPSELLYSGTIEPDKFLGLVRLKYMLSDLTDPKAPVLADSGSITYRFLRENADKRFNTQVPIRTEPGKRYQLEVTARDMVRNEDNLAYLYVDRMSNLSEQNFFVTLSEDKAPLYKPNVVGSAKIKIDYALQEHDSVYVYYYGREIPLPRPSFSMTREKEFLEIPDSVWIFPFSRAITYQLNYQGIYHFQLDTAKKEGLILANFGESYPKVQEAGQLIESLAYLTTSTEYEELKKSTNQKLAVDNFWLEKAGDIEKARELIKVYYNRVFFANYYFTSFKPGWKTDRGMIYIIYGPPQSVKVEPMQEKWIYYKNNFSTTVTFIFDYSPTDYSMDNYTLQRSDSYDTYWRNAVDTWRNGNIYLIE